MSLKMTSESSERLWVWKLFFCWLHQYTGLLQGRWLHDICRRNAASMLWRSIHGVNHARRLARCSRLHVQSYRLCDSRQERSPCGRQWWVVFLFCTHTFTLGCSSRVWNFKWDSGHIYGAADHQYCEYMWLIFTLYLCTSDVVLLSNWLNAK